MLVPCARRVQPFVEHRGIIILNSNCKIVNTFFFFYLNVSFTLKEGRLNLHIYTSSHIRMSNIPGNKPQVCKELQLLLLFVDFICWSDNISPVNPVGPQWSSLLTEAHSDHDGNV